MKPREAPAMFDRFSNALLRWLRVPPRPEPPLGAPGTERIFRSGRNALRLSLSLWAIKQVFALGGLIFGLWMLGQWTSMRGTEPASPPNPPPPVTVESPASDGTAATAEKKPRQRKPKATPRDVVEQISRKMPAGVFWLLTVLEGLSVVTFVVQIPVTFAIRRLDYEQRWYIVTDRSLRLRTGIWKMQEMTMSFANLQQITVTQGPLQRALGLADVRVQSAGGGGGGSHEPGHGQQGHSLHLGYFHAVDNAEEIRDLILERLRSFRESGLGDPDEARETPASDERPAVSADTLSAARELLAEARALRATRRG